MGFSRQEYWSGCHSLLRGTTFCQPSPPWPVRLGWPHTAWLSLTESDKAVVLWSDWLVFCDCGFSVPALWRPLATPTILLGFLLPLTWGISSRLLQQSTANASYLGQGVSPHGCPSWSLVAPLGLPEPAQLLLHTVKSCKEQYYIGTWNVRSRNQGKLEMVKQEMARVNVHILGISKLKWTGMDEFNSDDHYIYYCG